MKYQDSTKIVIKVGSALIAPSGNGCTAQYTLPIARFIHRCLADKKQVILVSSGSVAAGRNEIIYTDKWPTLAQKQAMAAIGQHAMMANWKRFFDEPCAQILVTHADLKTPKSRANIRNTINELIDNHVLPIVNENDSVATEELKVGDNDQLAAMMAILADADLFMICSDVDGLYTSDPKLDDLKQDDLKQKKPAQRVDFVEKIDEKIIALAGGTTNHIATGGMQTKIDAAIKATNAGIATLLFKGSLSENFEQFIKGKRIGTLFKAQNTALNAKNG